MDITIDDDQKMLRETAVAFAQKALTPERHPRTRRQRARL